MKRTVFRQEAILLLATSITLGGGGASANSAGVAPLAIQSVKGSDTFDAVTVEFSEAVTAVSAGIASHYVFDNGLGVTGVAVLNPSLVRLATTRQAPGTVYTLTINNIADSLGLAGNGGSQNSFTAFTMMKGGLKFEAFFDIPSTSVDTFINDPKYQSNSPDEVAYVTEFTSRFIFRDGSHDNYGGRISGWIVPEQTGDYEFFLKSNDTSRLFLSSDDNPTNAVLIAEETSCCGFFEEPGAPETSTPWSLTAGQSYYIYALWKEGTGADSCDVAWRKVGDPTEPRSLSDISGTVLETYADPETFVPPGITFTNPASGATFESGSAVALTATASAAAGKTVTKVEFLDTDETKLGEATSAPFSITLSNLVADLHKLTARVTDSAGLFTVSDPVEITVGALAQKIFLLSIDTNTIWSYDRSGVDLGRAWRERNFDDSGWPQGSALIADEDGPTAEPILTPISRFNDAGDYVTTFYFRTHFNFTNAISPGISLRLRHVVDDGAVFYLNGLEVRRFGMPDGEINAMTYATGHENTWEGPFDIPIEPLVAGDNIFAAEVHQSSNNSSDIVFGAELVARVPIPAPGPRFNVPVVQIGKLVLVWIGSGTLQTGLDVTGPWKDVEGATSPFSVSSLSETRMFYRLR